MNAAFDEDPEFLVFVKAVQFPDVYAIAAFAKARGIETSPQFWEVFDLVRARWMQNKSCEGFGELC